MASLPRREKSAVAVGWERLRELRALVDQRGMLVPATLAAKLVGVTPQRIHDLISSGRLELVQWDGKNYVTEDSLVEFAKSERKTGVHLAIPETKAQCARLAMEWAKENVKK